MRTFITGEDRSPPSLPGYRSARIGGARVIASEGNLSFVEEAITTAGSLYDWAAEHPEAEKIQGRATVFVVPGPGSARWLVRHLSHGGLLAPVTQDWFLRLGTPRPFNELKLSLEFSHLGVPTPKVAAAAIYPLGPIYRGEVARELVTDAADLAACMFGETRSDEPGRREAMSAAGLLLGTLFETGIIHRDLNFRNVLVKKRDGAAEALILDIEKCALRPELSNRQRQRMMKRFLRSASKFEELTDQKITDAEWKAFNKALGRRTN